MIIEGTEPGPLKLAIITGTSSGIGAGLAQALLEKGWHVLGLARRDVKFTSPHYRHIKADLADRTCLVDHAFPRLMEELKRSPWGRVALVNNAAAIGSLKGLSEISGEDLNRVYGVNVIAPGLLMGLVSRHVPPDTWLRIVNVSSGVAHRGLPGLADYAGSKAALRLTGMTLSTEFEQIKRSRAAILSYEPGVVETEMQAQARKPTGGFPSKEVFQGFHSRGILQPVSAVIQEMIRFMEDSESPLFTEKRFQPTP